MIETNRRTDTFRSAIPLAKYLAVRAQTERLCNQLEPDDYMLQPMPDASPAKWHLAHTTWFFETFFLEAFSPKYKAFDPNYRKIFNSYYVSIGERHARSERGLLSRPSTRDVYSYRKAIDEAIGEILSDPSIELPANALEIMTLGLHHEQQHQELILTDIKYSFSRNPLFPVYAESLPTQSFPQPHKYSWQEYAGGLVEIGATGPDFHFDNEGPRHKVYLRPFVLGRRLVTAGEYCTFIADGGYKRPELWLSDGWSACQREGWHMPLYWEKQGDRFVHFTLNGLQPVEPVEPVTHVSFYEVDAFARWSGARLPTEIEWEVAAGQTRSDIGNFLEDRRFHPRPAGSDSGMTQLFGDCWEWTSSPYVAYPGYRPAAGALGEYNGKFMCNQMVLRGGSCVSPRTHLRATYRNFFPPEARWQFNGIRLARDVN